jgi:branched-subunit amino acid aminotransferase/4-amino-4-deoxychorismate lyase
VRVGITNFDLVKAERDGRSRVKACEPPTQYSILEGVLKVTLIDYCIEQGNRFYSTYGTVASGFLLKSAS